MRGEEDILRKLGKLTRTHVIGKQKWGVTGRRKRSKWKGRGIMSEASGEGNQWEHRIMTHINEDSMIKIPILNMLI